MRQLNVSIVCYKTPIKLLQDLLQDLINSQGIMLGEIFLIDNSPTQELSQLSQLDPRINYRQRADNPGYGRSHNLAINQSIVSNRNGYHLVVNPDIRLGDDVLVQLLDFCEQHKECGLVMPKVVYPSGQLQPLCKLLPTPFHIFARRFLPQTLINRINYNYTMRWTEYRQIMQVPYLSGSFMLFRVSDLADLGGFDPRFFMYFEDTDISRRFYRHGKAWFYPQVTVVHRHNQESYRSLKMLWVHWQNMCHYFNKYGWWWDSERRQINYQVKRATSPTSQGN